MQSGRIKKPPLAPTSGTEAKPASMRANVRILVVGEVHKWQARGRRLPEDRTMAFVEFHELDREMLQLCAPETVLSPVLCGSFDCLDLALRLGELGFRGRYRAMANGLPDPWLIRQEIAESCPGLDFDIVDLSEASGQRLN